MKKTEDSKVTLVLFYLVSKKESRNKNIGPDFHFMQWILSFEKDDSEQLKQITKQSMYSVIHGWRCRQVNKLWNSSENASSKLFITG
jgi:hypothetical protein